MRKCFIKLFWHLVFSDCYLPNLRSGSPFSVFFFGVYRTVTLRPPVRDFTGSDEQRFGFHAHILINGSCVRVTDFQFIFLIFHFIFLIYQESTPKNGVGSGITAQHRDLGSQAVEIGISIIVRGSEIRLSNRTTKTIKFWNGLNWTNLSTFFNSVVFLL